MAGKMQLDPDSRDFIECCLAREVEFLIVGGYAMVAPGHPRSTKVLDVWLLVDPANAQRLVDTLDEPVPFIDAANLERNKLASARPQDLTDVHALRHPKP